MQYLIRFLITLIWTDSQYWLNVLFSRPIRLTMWLIFCNFAVLIFVVSITIPHSEGLFWF